MQIIVPILISIATLLFNIAIALEITNHFNDRDKKINNQIKKLYEERNNICR